MGPYLDIAKKAAPVVAAAYVTQMFTATQSRIVQGLAMLAAGTLAYKFVSTKL